MAGAWMAFVVVIAMWAAFGYATLAQPGVLEGLWEWVRGQHLVVQGLVWLAGLPWMIALSVWESSWAVWLRATVVLGMAWATINMFLPAQQ